MSRFDANRLLRGTARGFRLRRDDFSVQVSLEDDRLFFVRIDTERDGLVVSDLNPGDKPNRIAAEGLDYALSSAGCVGVAPITVLDVAPTHDIPPKKLEGLREIFGAYAAIYGKFVCAFSTTERRGRIDLLVDFD